MEMVVLVAGVILLFVLILAPLKLYDIDKTLKAILEELKIARISRPGGPE